MNMQKLLRNRWVILGLGLLIGLLFIVILSRGGPVIDPSKNTDLNLGDGKTTAMLFKFNELYDAIDQNDDVLELVSKDVLLFARTTRSELNNPETLVGFTFEEGVRKDGENSIFTGHYYGVDDKMQIILTPHGRGVYSLSITNLEDGTNIDNYLKMNGKQNKYLQTLPIEKNNYSIAYQLTEDRIVVSFYDGYTSADIDEVVRSLTEGLGSDSKTTVIYSINRIGIVSLDAVRQNLVTPLPKP